MLALKVFGILKPLFQKGFKRGAAELAQHAVPLPNKPNFTEPHHHSPPLYRIFVMLSTHYL
jgi:hypothetical protein